MAPGVILPSSQGHTELVTPGGRGSHVAALIAASIASRGSGSARRWSLPTSTNADLGRPLVLRISSLSSKAASDLSQATGRSADVVGQGSRKRDTAVKATTVRDLRAAGQPSDIDCEDLGPESSNDLQSAEDEHLMPCSLMPPEEGQNRVRRRAARNDICYCPLRKYPDSETRV